MYTVKNILVTTDFSEYSAAALDYALSFATTHRAVVHLLHVVDDHHLFHDKDHDNTEGVSVKGITAREEMQRFVQGHVDELVLIEQVIRHGVPHLEIIRYAKEYNIDIIVMATHGRTGLAHAIIGSIAEKVVRYSPLPVLTVKPRAVLEKIVTDEDVEQNLHLFTE